MIVLLGQRHLTPEAFPTAKSKGKMDFGHEDKMVEINMAMAEILIHCSACSSWPSELCTKKKK